MKSKTQLSQICKIILSGTPKTSVLEYWHGKIKWVTPTDITNINQRYIQNTKRTISEKGIQNSSAKLLDKDTIIISARGTVGELCILPFEMSCNQSCYALKPDLKLVKPLYLFYVLKNLKSHYNQIAHGTTFDTITKSTFDEIKINLHSLKEQEKIINHLDHLDSQIENLQKQNKILEQIAQAIFKSWFIDFDGISEFGDSELGKIPKGWQIKKMENVLDLTKGISYKSQDLKFSDKALVTLKSIKRGGGYANKGLKSYVGKYTEQQIVKEYDLVVAQTDLTQNADVIGKPALIQHSKNFHTLIASLDLSVIKIKNEKLSKSFLYYLMLTKKFQNHMYGYASGTTVLHLSKDAIPSFLFVLPPDEIITRFDKIVFTIIQKNHKHNEIIENLLKIRNLLLPKLMSGEIKV